jgi:hypothetical protein
MHKRRGTAVEPASIEACGGLCEGRQIEQSRLIAYNISGVRCPRTRLVRSTPQAAACSTVLRPDGDRAAFHGEGRGRNEGRPGKISTDCIASKKGDEKSNGSLAAHELECSRHSRGNAPAGRYQVELRNHRRRERSSSQRTWRQFRKDALSGVSPFILRGEKAIHSRMARLSRAPFTQRCRNSGELP